MNVPVMMIEAAHTGDEARLMPAPTSRFPLPYLRAWRLHLLKRQIDLTNASGVGVSTLVRAEAGAPVNALTAAKLARALGVTVRQLREEEPPA